MKAYWVSSDSDALEPEESLLEAVSPDSRIERPIKSGFFILLYFLVYSALIVFAVVGFKLGIINNDYFAGLSARNKYIAIPIVPERGLIYSREGEILAENKSGYSLWLLPLKMSDRKDEIILALSDILGVSLEFLSDLINNNSGQASFVISEEIDEGEKEKILSLNSPGLVVVSHNTRLYPAGEIFSHLIGYVSLVNEEDLNKDSFYKINDKIGRSGLESFYENELRGQRGEMLIGRFKDESQNSEPQSGNSLILNIDSQLQKNIYYELQNGLREAGSGAGVAVAINPKNGVVLSLVNLPSYDNNSFIKGLTQEEYNLFFRNTAEPLFNKVVSGRFAPGSTIKPLIALAALEEKVISPAKKINAPGFITITSPYNDEITYTFRDWKNHGWVNMREAIAFSSDIYFYTVGGGFYDVEGLGIEKIAKYLKMFKLDSATGIDLNGEAAGFVPSPEWKREYRNEIWYQGDTFNVSIGQGDLLVTPLWLTSFIGALGNGEAMYRPFIVDKILDQNGTVVKSFQPETLFELSFSDESLKVVREGMKMAAEVGTAKVFADLPVEVGAKSGTAEVIKGQSTNSWISVFAPYDNPQLVLTIMMESGREGSYIPHQIAYRILKNYFEN